MKSETLQPKSAKRDLKSEIGLLKRERIIVAAAELFAAQGYHGVSVEAVAEALGVTKPFIYYNFRDKNELLAAICRRGAELTFSAVQSVERRPGTYLERLAEFCRRLANIVIDNRTFIAIYNREEIFLHKEDRAAIAKLRSEIDRHVCELIEGAAAAGEALVIDPKTTATAITVMISALWFWYRRSKSDERSRMVESIVALSLRMVGANIGIQSQSS